jgi:FtsP/CotA-like multicopper oxidase with cupredoxin domain
MSFTRFRRFTFALSSIGFLLSAGCADSEPADDVETVTSAIGDPSANQVPLDPTTIPQFVNQLTVPRVFAPTLVMQNGQVVRHDYTINAAKTLAQLLPPPLPQTNVLAYGGQVKIPGSSQTEFVRSTPGSTFEETKNLPTRVTWQNEIRQPYFLPVDPTLHFANPLYMEPPLAPFLAFPPGYNNAQSLVPHVTHMHGLVVRADMDGTAEEWFTPSPGSVRGPGFVTQSYDMPNVQSPTQLFYHEHALGDTRLGVYAGLAGAGYFIRDPASALDGPGTPLPTGQYEIPLILTDRAFFTDGELSFPRTSTNVRNAYWQAGDGANAILVNGKVWPNLNVERRQYRFRMLAAGNGRTWNPQLDLNGVAVPFIIIGTDGGYLPAPQTITTFTFGITERADILVDFSPFPAGTQITMLNVGGNPAATLGQIMRFTVQNTTPVTPPALNPALFPAKPALPTDAPLRVKTFMNLVDEAQNAERSVDGLMFSSPDSEFPLVGSTEQWDLVNVGGGGHQVHLHLIEFQVVSRQTINTAAYLQQWNLLNGFKPVSRPIVVDPTPFLTGTPQPPPAIDTGWKDTVRAPSNQLTRIIARWAPQETPTGGVAPGQNQFPIDPTAAQGSYLMHCHVLGHEDNDMMRKLPIAPLWAGGVSYPVGRVVTHLNINYRIRVAHTSSASQPPPTRFDRYERVNNNEGAWQPQIIYAVGDRVLSGGLLFRALSVHQAQTGQTPQANPALWQPLPMTACGQLAQFCADDTGIPAGATCLATGQAGVEANCLTSLATCLPVCEPVHATPCSGLCNNPISFTVADGANFQSGNLGTGATCHETTSEIQSGAGSSFVSPRVLTVNGRAMPLNGNWPQPLPPQRNMGYCIQTTAGNQPWAAFTAF